MLWLELVSDESGATTADIDDQAAVFVIRERMRDT